MKNKKKIGGMLRELWMPRGYFEGTMDTSGVFCGNYGYLGGILRELWIPRGYFEGTMDTSGVFCGNYGYLGGDICRITMTMNNNINLGSAGHSS